MNRRQLPAMFDVGYFPPNTPPEKTGLAQCMKL
jgi:hypothetical protein